MKGRLQLLKTVVDQGPLDVVREVVAYKQSCFERNDVPTAHVSSEGSGWREKRFVYDPRVAHE